MGVVNDRGPEFDGVRIGRPATGALLDAGYTSLADLPGDLHTLLTLHGVGPSAVRRLEAARTADAKQVQQIRSDALDEMARGAEAAGLYDVLDGPPPAMR